MSSHLFCEDFALRSVSGRFIDADVEKSFVASRVEGLLIHIRVMFFIGALFLAVGVVNHAISDGQWNSFGSAPVVIGLFAFSLAVAAATKAHNRVKWCSCSVECCA